MTNSHYEPNPVHFPTYLLNKQYIKQKINVLSMAQRLHSSKHMQLPEQAKHAGISAAVSAKQTYIMFLCGHAWVRDYL